MPQFYTSKVSALTARQQTPTPSGGAGIDSFGGGVAQATQGLGQQSSRAVDFLVGEAVKDKAKSRDGDIANSVALFDNSAEQLALRNEVGPDGEGLQDRSRETYLAGVDEHVREIEDDETRAQVRQRLTSQLPGVSSAAASAEAAMGSSFNQEETNTALASLENKITQFPFGYDEFVVQGNAVIDGVQGIPQNLKEGMKRNWRQDSARRRFEGSIAQAQSLEAIDRIASDLAGEGGGKDWTQEFNPVDYTATINKIGVKRNAFMKASTSQARASLTAAEGRLDKGSVPSHAELQGMQRSVKGSRNPSLVARSAKVTAAVRQRQTYGNSTPAQLRAVNNSAMGNPNAVYPNLPPVVSTAITPAAQDFGVNPSYLGGMITREVGGQFKKRDARAEKKYAPRDGDLKGLTYDVINAATRAGESLGYALAVTETKGGSFGSLNVSTLGMSAEEISNVTLALVDAGFTDFAEKEGSLHVNMSPQVSAAFGAQGEVFDGGWGHLSSSVTDVLIEKGFSAGVAEGDIQRANAIRKEDEQDFAIETQIKDAQGKPTSSALGISQFTKKTFLTLMKDPGYGPRIWGDVVGMSDEEILSLRGDPTVSVRAGAALASQNKKRLENTLGREVGDAELYMAHFLGPAASISLIRQSEANPNQSAASLFPQQAKANRPVFFEGNRARTVGEVYSNISASFITDPSQIAFDDIQTRKKMIDETEKGLKEDPVSMIMQSGALPMSGLDEDGGFALRGQHMLAAADYYTTPTEDMKPFSVDEAAFFSKQIEDGNVDDVVGIMAQVQNMPEKVAEAALGQLGVSDPVFSHAGQLYLQGGVSTATDVMRGQKLLKENPNVLVQLGIERLTVSETFGSVLNGAMFDESPSVQKATQDAALALTVRKMTSSSAGERFDRVFEQSIHEVMGGAEGAAFDEVNGHNTVLPVGMDASQLTTALERMQLQDWASMSKSGDIPLYADGEPVNPDDIGDEVMLRSLGGGEYHVMLDDGKLLRTKEIDGNGRARPFVLIPNRERMMSVVNSPLPLSLDQRIGKGVQDAFSSVLGGG